MKETKNREAAVALLEAFEALNITCELGAAQASNYRMARFKKVVCLALGQSRISKARFGVILGLAGLEAFVWQRKDYIRVMGGGDVDRGMGIESCEEMPTVAVFDEALEVQILQGISKLHPSKTSRLNSVLASKAEKHRIDLLNRHVSRETFAAADLEKLEALLAEIKGALE